MRRFVSLAGAIAVIAASAGLATTTSVARVHGHAAAALCGTLYTPPCRPPSGTVISIPSCRNTGAILNFPITASANAGLRSVMVRMGSTTVKNFTFTGRPTHKSVAVSVNTHGFKPGLYTLTVKVTDVRGKNTTRLAHFTICKPKPVFTG
jgi:hypothetical protein